MKTLLSIMAIASFYTSCKETSHGAKSSVKSSPAERQLANVRFLPQIVNYDRPEERIYGQMVRRQDPGYFKDDRPVSQAYLSQYYCFYKITNSGSVSSINTYAVDLNNLRSYLSNIGAQKILRAPQEFVSPDNRPSSHQYTQGEAIDEFGTFLATYYDLQIKEDFKQRMVTVPAAVFQQLLAQIEELDRPAKQERMEFEDKRTLQPDAKFFRDQNGDGCEQALRVLSSQEVLGTVRR